MSFSDNYKQGEKTPIIEPKTAKKLKWGWVAENNSTLFSIILLIITLAVLFLVNITGDNDFRLSEISAPAIILSVLSYLFFVNNNRTGDKACRNSEKYRKTISEYEDLTQRIYDEKKLFKLDFFCREYVKDKYKKTVMQILAPVEVEWEDFVLVKNKQCDKEFNDEQVMAIRKALKVRPIKLTRAMLMKVEVYGSTKKPIKSSSAIIGYQVWQYVWKAITIVCSLFFTFTLAYSFIFDFSQETIWRGVLQLIIIAFSIFGGLSVGYKVRSMWRERTQDVSNILKEFFEWEQTNEKSLCELEINGKCNGSKVLKTLDKK